MKVWHVFIVILILTSFVVISVFGYSLLPECDYESSGFVRRGTMLRSAHCTCLGLKLGYDDRPVDGDLRYGCLGIITSKQCEQYVLYGTGTSSEKSNLTLC